MEQFISVFVWAAILQGLFLCFIYFFNKQFDHKANRILALFLLSLISEGVNLIIPVERIGDFSVYHYFELPEMKLFLPVTFTHFVLLKMGKYQKYVRILKGVYLIAAALLLLTLVNVVSNVALHKNLREVMGPEVVEIIFMTQQTIAWILSVAACMVVVYELLLIEKAAQNTYSDITLLNIKWLWQFALILIPVVLLWGVELFRIFLGGTGSSEIVWVTWIVLFFIIYLVSFKAFTQQNLFGPDVVEEVQEPEPDQNQGQDESELTEVVPILETYMTEKRPFLKSDLTLHELAALVGLPSRKLSQCINQHFNMNFTTWINSYRVDTAITLLRNDENAYLSIEGIGFQSGFKSRSAMYLAFKKLNKGAPGDYKFQNSVSKDVF